MYVCWTEFDPTLILYYDAPDEYLAHAILVCCAVMCRSNANHDTLLLKQPWLRVAQSTHIACSPHYASCNVWPTVEVMFCAMYPQQENLHPHRPKMLLL
jgi:hypothetical protein